ncbi:hypothetical protein L3i20_v206890 [Paenibacillus sp. L3-i20]|nr:hypothetical protein L3i20_v206890 [Paenibacillus sp. L3-i20]
MRYFTTEMYEKMQVRGALVFPANQEELELVKQRYVEYGRDFEALTTKSFEIIKPLLLKYAPEPIIELIERGELTGIHYPKPEVLTMVKQWRTELDEEWKEACRQYQDGYANYEHKLPVDRKIIHLLHDSKLLEININEDGNIELLLDSSSSMLNDNQLRLHFHGVSEYELSEDMIGNWWLYEELFWNEEEGSCTVNALLSSPLGYLTMNVLKIVAKDVSVQFSYDKR